MPKNPKTRSFPPQKKLDFRRQKLDFLKKNSTIWPFLCHKIAKKLDLKCKKLDFTAFYLSGLKCICAEKKPDHGKDAGTYNSDAQRTVNNNGYIRYLSLCYRGHTYPANFAGYPCVLLRVTAVDAVSDFFLLILLESLL